MLIAAPIAARMGLERLYSIDDQSVYAPTPANDEKAYGAAIEKAWDNPANAKRKAIDDALVKQLDTGDRVLTLYCNLNAPDQGKLVFDSDFGAALNIREMFGTRPGIRALVVVGASHKPYLDAYLNEMHDVRIADVAALLR